MGVGMSTLLRPGKEIAAATIEIIDPFEQPLRYGAGLLASQLRDLPNNVSRPPLDVGALDHAAEAGDDASARELLIGVENWLHHEPPFDILDGGSGEVEIPFLAAAAPDVEAATVTATQTSAATTSGEISFKLFGIGPSADAKITISSGYELKCARAEAQIAYVCVPVLWQWRAHPGNHDSGTWVHIEPVKRSSSTPAKIKVALVPNLGHPLVTGRLRIDLLNGGTLPGTPTYSYTVKGGIGFTVGFKAESIGIDASVTVSMEREVEIKLQPELPSRHQYETQWLSGPPGVSVITLG